MHPTRFDNADTSFEPVLQSVQLLARVVHFGEWKCGLNLGAPARGSFAGCALDAASDGATHLG